MRSETASLIELTIQGLNKNPHAVLGMHSLDGAVVVRVFNPHSQKVTVRDVHSGRCYPMEKTDERGFFEAVIEAPDLFAYQLVHTTTDGASYTVYDPYAFLPTVSDYDTYLFNQGNHHCIYEKLGCHLREVNGVKGASFAVWAPSAQRVSVVGSFNQWDGRIHQMRMLGSSGVWELFIPGLAPGDLYKYEIKTPSGELYIKADPFAFYAEKPPQTASRVYDMDDYQWHDEEWLAKRAKEPVYDKPVNIYEVHLGSWQQEPDPDPDSETGFRPLSYRQLAERLIPYAKKMGYTHLELLPVMEHPYDGSWGYQVTGYYAVTSRYGTPADFKYFVDKCHENGLGVILDWVPAHFPKDGHGLARFDGTALYEHEDIRKGEHLEWGTHVFNYGRHEVRNFLIANALFWFDKYHVDGLRVDAVASMLYLDYCRKPGEWIPNEYGGRENLEAVEFLRQLNTTVYRYYPNVMMIAEESTAWPKVTAPVHEGGLGFSHKWNMGWMNDFLRYVGMDSVYRKYHQNLITFSFMYAWSENFILVLSHDEVVHGKKSLLDKMPGDYWQKFAGLRGALGYFMGHPGKKLLFMGGEFGQFIEWKYKESLDWHLLGYPMHQKLHDYVADLNHFYLNEPALYEIDSHYDGFEWIDCSDTEHSIVSFIRKGKDWRDMLVFVCNFTPATHDNYRIGAPLDTVYTEVFNSDLEQYGGSHVANEQPVKAEPVPWHGKSWSIILKVPPLATIVLRPDTSKFRDSAEEQ
ncbi:MAG TPA: 1,4-alpha-glucan branching protein GlgB [Thermoclostridium caenicola]|uniref:1,4-alpha-glucan branching protein GlgB n=1 Tax=Thermoclostridium caenicola TaxID=659425 RepID=UPI002C9FBA08|nr:1,4-alpha-glucan branching protein GlgB [Thermoclostridium caenicola]HOL84562.1 1,4-alpha-glucan branching protein GlgB [Thermoclostridium caenicola]HPO76306.1 1,4-alpha-glucan branching protein GlgB [Thermoclostridium caenicola]